MSQTTHQPEQSDREAAIEKLAEHEEAWRICVEEDTAFAPYAQNALDAIREER